MLVLNAFFSTFVNIVIAKQSDISEILSILIPNHKMTENSLEGLKWKEKAYQLVHFSQRNVLFIAAELNLNCIWTNQRDQAGGRKERSDMMG